ncbi:nuclear transport factor 2 family protein [Streptomyces sp. NPDC002680]|uniref:nuclear transport factor 2 family protein n=1 Tax=Streptomyces sp. NPDC002680 TaxID=3364659 RepID=UPI00369DB678
MTDLDLDPGTVPELDRARREAMIRADIPALTRMLADDMVWIHGNGGVDSKQGLLGSISSGRTKYLAIDCADETVRLHGGLAFLGGITAVKADIGGHILATRSRYTVVWAPDGDVWRVVSWQSTLIL